MDKASVCERLKPFLALPLAARLLLIFCVGALITAYIGEYFFHMSPCILCLYQRVPYAAVAVLSAVLLFLGRQIGRDKALLSLCALLFVVGMGIAGFHSGVERHLWEGTDGCEVKPMEHPITQQTIDDIRNQLLAAPVARCDVIDWSLFGLTLANLNIFAFLGLAVFSGLAAAEVGKES